MAKLMLIGDAARVELTTDDEDEQIIAICRGHEDGMVCPAGCGSMGVYWTERYDTLGDAVENAADHADTGRE